nr:MAG TPA: hypothetical protein [Bacteriophage sp.]
MNIAEILKYCHKGTKLYSLINGEVLLNNVESGTQYPIEVTTTNIGSEYFTKDGLYIYHPNGECILFPSKKQRDWNKFRLPTNIGDIMMKYDGSCPFISTGELYKDISPKYICGINSLGEFEKSSRDKGWTSEFYIPASEEAKKELFGKMTKAGYRWNADTLELEKIESKFKEGNVILKNNTLFLSTGVIINDILQVYCLCNDGTFVSCGLSLASLELAPEKYKNALFSAITKGGYRYDKEHHKLIKQEFKPFDKVLVKNESNQEWSINLFSYYDKEDKEHPYVCINECYSYCIPYEGNEYFVGKTVNIH